MYKVFVNDCPIVLTDNENIFSEFSVVDFDSIDVLEVVEAIYQNDLKGIYLFCNDLDACFAKFQTNFKISIAAGGRIMNSKNETLFIYRLGKWDLPKGKLEKEETVEECAIRESQEECGIPKLRIEKKIGTTYHIFKQKKQFILKTTHWFLMHTDYSGKLIPQSEEGIEQVLFKNKSEVSLALQNTYANIKLLF